MKDQLFLIDTDCGAGETTVGRNEGDIVIEEPSVSSSHAAIDVVDLPGGRGKRVTLKVRWRRPYCIPVGILERTCLASTMWPREKSWEDNDYVRR